MGKHKLAYYISLAIFFRDDVMRKFLSVSVMVFFIFIFLISTANATLLTSNILNDPSVIDFSQFSENQYSQFQDPVQVGDLVGFDVTISGQPFTGSDGAYLWNSNWGLIDNGSWNSGRNGYAGFDARQTGTGTLMFSFNNSPISSVGAFINDAPGHGDLLVSAYDADMNLLESYDIWDLAPISTPGMLNAGGFRGIGLETALISHFSITGYIPVADDLAFTTTPIPEPATIILFGTGLLCLAGLGRKKFRNR